MNITLRTAITLCAFLLVALALLLLVNRLTARSIAASEHARLSISLTDLLPVAYDNDPATDMILIRNEALGSARPLPVYRARVGNEAVAAVLSVVAPDGYSGEIELLVGVNYDAQLNGVRAVKHRETPGLGDRIDAHRSDWIHGFAGLEPRTMNEHSWRVKKDGGQFDQLTGATITPRAIVAAVYQAIQWYGNSRQEVFALKSSAVPEVRTPR